MKKGLRTWSFVVSKKLRTSYFLQTLFMPHRIFTKVFFVSAFGSLVMPLSFCSAELGVPKAEEVDHKALTRAQWQGKLVIDYCEFQSLDYARELLVDYANCPLGLHRAQSALHAQQEHSAELRVYADRSSDLSFWFAYSPNDFQSYSVTFPHYTRNTLQMGRQVLIFPIDAAEAIGTVRRIEGESLILEQLPHALHGAAILDITFLRPTDFLSPGDIAQTGLIVFSLFLQAKD